MFSQQTPIASAFWSMGVQRSRAVPSPMVKLFGVECCWASSKAAALQP